MNKAKLSCLLRVACICVFTALSVTAQSGPPIPPPISTHTLSFWPLETPPWESSAGLPASAFTNLNLAPSWDYEGTALSVDTNVPAFLQLYVFQDGKTNISLASGSLEIWCQPNWTSVADGGTGPGAWATVWDLGQYTPDASAGAWLLAVDPSGSNLVWLAQAGGSNQFLWTPIGFNAGDWHQVVATWSSSNACLYVDGALATNAGPFLYGPGTLECSNDGFCVGSLTASGTNAGTNQFQGQLQWLVSYAQPLTTEEVSNSYAQVADYITYFGYSAPGGGGFHPDSGPPGPGGGWGTNFGGTNGGGGAEVESFTPPASISATNYAAYNQFYLTITNDSTNAYVYVCNTLSNLTYIVLTNRDMSNTNGWSPWEVLLASNSLTPAPAISLASNTLFFEAVLVGSTGTNGLPDWWQMKYFGQLNVDPYADPDSDGLCNLDEYMLGTNPTNAYSVSSLHKDAQALFLAFTNYDSGCKYELFVTNGSDTNTVLVMMSPTLVGTNYQIYSHNESDTNDTWIVETNFIGTNSVTTVAVALNGRTLDFVGGYGEDSDGDGLPDGYEVLATWTDPLLPDTGLTGTPDGYKDPDGDGYSNLQEMYNGTNPHVFDTPYGPINPEVVTTNDGSGLVFSWEPASGPVQEYIVSAYNYETGNWNVLTNTSASQTSYTLGSADAYIYAVFGFTDVTFTVQATYPNGASFASENSGSIPYQSVVAQSALAHGPGGKSYLLVSTLTSNITGYSTLPGFFRQNYPEFPAYGQSQGLVPSYNGFQSNVYVPASQFTNGIAALANSQEPEYAKVTFDYLYPAVSWGGPGNITGPQSISDYANVPFVDGSAQLKQNESFLLRAANYYPFGYFLLSGPLYSYTYPTNYVFASYYYVDPNGYYGSGPHFDHFAPFEDNYFFRNFAFTTSTATTQGTYVTGFYPWNEGYTAIAGTNTQFEFATYDYVVHSNGASIPSILPSDDTQWTGFVEDYGVNITNYGAYYSSGAMGLSNGYANIYGLPYTSLGLPISNNVVTLYPGSEVTGYYWDLLGGDPFFTAVAEPELQTVGYYFARPYTYVYSYAEGYHSVLADPLPGYQDGSFSVTNTTPMMLGSVGTPMLVAGYAKQAILNGYTNAFAYLGQYFSNALIISNGTVTTNPTGILSEYGEFFPTVPGEVALQTMPDPDQGNTNGTCVVDIIRLSLDVNHDGIMDESFTGPDNTGNGISYVFWVNNNYDRWDHSTLDGWVEDDVATTSSYAGCPYTPTLATPDYTYRDINGNRIIPCPRDLEDFARLWVSGISSNVLTNLPSGSTVTLSWAGIGTTPTIDLFQAADADGGIGYLTNLTTASNQINTNLCQYVGRLGPGGSIQLNASTFSNSWAGNHYIWCGCASGSDQLNLTIADGSGNILAQSSQYIQLQDIKQMYERWTVGDAPPAPPMTNAVLAEDNFSPGYPTTPFQYSYDPAYDTNDTYILFVHGYNMENWEKDRFAETAYKRLYWQGYQGRFGSFRWPTYTHFYDYDVSETQAWNSGIGLKRFLTSLNAQYPGNVYVLAHSMGNVVTGEALRLAGTNEIVNTYVASQAAVSARAYDNALPADLTNAYYFHVQTPDSEGHYYTNGAPSYFSSIGGAGKFISFFNSQDWALGKWDIDQATNPDLLYTYVTPSLTYPSGYYYAPSPITRISLIFTNNTYQIFSRCVQSYSFALGAETNLVNPFPYSLCVNLQSAPYNFLSTHPGHSQQFRFDNPTTAVYWKQLLSSFQIEP